MASKMFPLLAVVTLGVAACSDGTGPSPGQQTITLNVATATASGAAGSAAAPESLTVSGHTLAFDKVEVVLREIRLKRAGEEGAVCTDGMPEGTSGAATGDEQHDVCEFFETGPFLVDLPLGGGPERILSIDVDTGTYRRAEFRVHKPDGSTDAAFVAAHPDFDQISIRVTGSYDGKAFTYTTSTNAKQVASLDPALEVTAAGPTNLTLTVDLKKWFVNGGQIIDPALAVSGQKAALVDDNIRNSFRLFKDQDVDGREDR